jgi:MYXO-CTERM domain-containing protein
MSPKTTVRMLACSLAGSLAALASAEVPTWQPGDLQSHTITLTGDYVSTLAEGDVRYDASAGPYASLAVGEGQRGFNYYQTAGAGSEMFLGQFKFVGGTNTVGGEVIFNFYGWNGTVGEIGSLVNSFTVALPQAGAFVWTITLDPDFVVPTLGYVEMVNGTGGLSRWFLTQTAPSIGTSFGSPFEAYPSQGFAMIEGVPAPGAIALLGLAGLAGRRRRG